MSEQTIGAKNMCAGNRIAEGFCPATQNGRGVLEGCQKKLHMKNTRFGGPACQLARSCKFLINNIYLKSIHHIVGVQVILGPLVHYHRLLRYRYQASTTMDERFFDVTQAAKEILDRVDV